MSTLYQSGHTWETLGPLGDSRHDWTVPCALCISMSSRSVQVMLPAKTSCPDDTWVMEYRGYLMTNSDYSRWKFRRTEFLCVDEEAEVIAKANHSGDTALLFHVRVSECSDDTFPCSGYDPAKELACVICSK